MNDIDIQPDTQTEPLVRTHRQQKGQVDQMNLLLPSPLYTRSSILEAHALNFKQVRKKCPSGAADIVADLRLHGHSVGVQISGKAVLRISPLTNEALLIAEGNFAHVYMKPPCRLILARYLISLI